MAYTAPASAAGGYQPPARDSLSDLIARSNGVEAAPNEYSGGPGRQGRRANSGDRRVDRVSRDQDGGFPSGTGVMEARPERGNGWHGSSTMGRSDQDYQGDLEGGMGPGVERPVYTAQPAAAQSYVHPPVAIDSPAAPAVAKTGAGRAADKPASCCARTCRGTWGVLTRNPLKALITILVGGSLVGSNVAGQHGYGLDALGPKAKEPGIFEGPYGRVSNTVDGFVVDLPDYSSDSVEQAQAFAISGGSAQANVKLYAEGAFSSYDDCAETFDTPVSLAAFTGEFGAKITQLSANGAVVGAAQTHKCVRTPAEALAMRIDGAKGNPAEVCKRVRESLPLIKKQLGFLNNTRAGVRLTDGLLAKLVAAQTSPQGPEYAVFQATAEGGEFAGCDS
jgi:hypothetical protein